MAPDIEDGGYEVRPEQGQAGNPVVNPAVAPDAYPARRSGSDPQRLTTRERRRRIVLLVVLLLLLALLGYASYYFYQNRSLPNLGLTLRPFDTNYVEPPQYLYSIAGTGANQLGRPVGVDIADDGRVYVVDFVKHRVSVFADPGRVLAPGRFLFAFGDKGEGQLKNPVHLVVKDDEVWVSDRRRKEIVIFGLDGTYKRVFDAGDLDGQWTPLAFQFDPKGGVVVSDVGLTDTHRVHFFDAAGAKTATVGETVQVVTSEEAPLGFYFPNGVAVADDGRVYVSDGDNRRVQVLTPDAKFKGFVNTSGLPRGIAIDKKERLYVADALAHTVDIYDLNGKAITQFGERGFGPGQFNFPNDVAIDERNGRIFVSDRENHQVQVWGWPTAAVPPVPAPKTPLGWLACLAPLLFIPPFLLWRRKIRIVVTPDFITALAEAGELKLAERTRRLRLIAPEEDRPLYEGKVADDVDLEDYLVFEPYSESDASLIAEKYQAGPRESMLLAMAMQARALATTNVELRRLAIYSDTRVVDAQEFGELYLRRRGNTQSH